MRRRKLTNSVLKRLINEERKKLQETLELGLKHPEEVAKRTKEVDANKRGPNDLEERIEAIRQRYMAQFSAMETAVTGFKKTGEFLTGFIDSLSPDK